MFAISRPSILLYYPRGGGDSFMIHMLHVWLSFSIIIIQGEGLIICIIFFPGKFLPFREEFSRLGGF